MSIIIILVAVVSAIKIFHHDDSFQTLERTDRQTHSHTDRPRCRVDLALRAGSTKNKLRTNLQHSSALLGLALGFSLVDFQLTPPKAESTLHLGLSVCLSVCVCVCVSVRSNV